MLEKAYPQEWDNSVVEALSRTSEINTDINSQIERIKNQIGFKINQIQEQAIRDALEILSFNENAKKIAGQRIDRIKWLNNRKKQALKEKLYINI